ncbi:type VI secretion system secreted protein VgrG [Paraburkholderia lycopersici]|uniref:Type VI secretion system secreted protein VgrG n=1 Tax=Paraburkholderia lycopersici TaxID=416944 RepID=A0A1G6XDX2_9BURK|nr:type VI secretion system secreted protein VgrG [Paraburkholderia lycopersici]
MLGGPNSYTYADNQPAGAIDPLGLATIAAGAGTGAEIGSIGGPIGAAAGAIVGGLIGFGVLLFASKVIESSETKVDCPSNKKACPPCKTVTGRIVARGTVGYRPLDVIPDNEMQHGVYGSHHNIFVANQNPNNCQCFWAKQKYVLKPGQLTSAMVPVEEFVN